MTTQALTETGEGFTVEDAGGLEVHVPKRFKRESVVGSTTTPNFCFFEVDNCRLTLKMFCEVLAPTKFVSTTTLFFVLTALLCKRKNASRGSVEYGSSTTFQQPWATSVQPIEFTRDFRAGRWQLRVENFNFNLVDGIPSAPPVGQKVRPALDFSSHSRWTPAFSA